MCQWMIWNAAKHGSSDIAHSLIGEKKRLAQEFIKIPQDFDVGIEIDPSE